VAVQTLVRQRNFFSKFSFLILHWPKLLLKEVCHGTGPIQT